MKNKLLIVVISLVASESCISQKKDSDQTNNRIDISTNTADIGTNRFILLIKSKILMTFLLLIALAPCTGQQKSTHKMNNSLEFIKVSVTDPRYFVTADGKPWIPIMINFIIPNGKEEEVFKDVEKYFKHFSENGGNAMRIWISSPFLEIEDKKVGEYDPVKFKRIDSVLSLAKKYGIQVKFTLQHIRSIQPVAPSGFGWANRAFMSLKEGGPFKNIKDYVSSPEGKKAYLNRIRALSKRYKDNKQIFGWELWNEINSFGIDWYPFTKEMLDSVKSLFPHQLVVQTLGSMFNQEGVNDYMELLTLKNNDYITIHRYLDPGTKLNQAPIVQAPIDSMVAEAIHTVYRPAVLKPVVYNEIGATAPNFSGPSKLYEKDTMGVLAHDMIFAPFFCGAAGCGSMWYGNDYVEKNKLWYHYERFKHTIADVDPIEEHFVPFEFNNDSVRCYGLKGKNTTMIWCRDAENNWKTELQQDIKPMIKKGFSFPLQVTGKTNFTSAKVYDPWKDKWTKVEIKNGVINVPPFLRSIVVLLNYNGGISADTNRKKTVSPSNQSVPIGDLPTWKQIFYDDFTKDAPLGSWGSECNSDSIVYTGAQGQKWRSYPKCFTDTYQKRHYGADSVLSVKDGMLIFHLHAIDGQPAGANPSLLINDHDQYQTYGRYTARFKVTNSSLSEYHIAWLLWPKSNKWPDDGEEDFPEGSLGGDIGGFHHYGGKGACVGCQDPVITNEKFTDWHTYTMEWRPGNVKYILDGQVILNSNNWVPDKPMRWQLQTETKGYGSHTGKLMVDWVAVYKYDPKK